MNFRIANTFTASLRKLDGAGQKAAKDTASKMQLGPANPGMQFHRINQPRDDHFWSVRASRDIRLIVHKTASSHLLCYVDHHDRAYQWAERRESGQSVATPELRKRRSVQAATQADRWFAAGAKHRSAPRKSAMDRGRLALGCPPGRRVSPTILNRWISCSSTAMLTTVTYHNYGG